MSPSPHRRSFLFGAAAAVPVAALTKAAGAASAGLAEDGALLRGRSVLITGCSSGFGYLGALHYADLGAKVFATMRNMPRQEAKDLALMADDRGLDITILELDVTSDRQVARAVDRAQKAVGGALDAVINNAGIAYGGPVELQDMRATEHIFDTNVFGPHRLARAALPAMRAAGGGHIINISSQLGRVIIPNFGQYSATKFALEAMSEQLAYEVAAQGIDVTIIEPGGYPTDIWENSRSLTDALLKRTPADIEEVYAAYLTALEGRGQPATDPMDIPRAIVSAMTAPAGKRPLRLSVHPSLSPQDSINEVSAATQRMVLETVGQGAVATAIFGDEG